MKTLILGASNKPLRYAYKALLLLRRHAHEVVAVGSHAELVSDVPILTELPANIPNLHTVTMYLNPDRQKPYYKSVIALKPKRIIFNPGAENSELAQLAQQNGIAVENACTLVLLNTGQY